MGRLTDSVFLGVACVCVITNASRKLFHLYRVNILCESADFVNFVPTQQQFGFVTSPTAFIIKDYGSFPHSPG